MEILKDYREWVSKDIPVTADWEEELHHLIFLRESLHAEIEHGKSLAAEARKIDERWQASILRTSDGSFVIDIDRADKPKDEWWWWIDQFDSLTTENRSKV